MSATAVYNRHVHIRAPRFDMLSDKLDINVIRSMSECEDESGDGFIASERQTRQYNLSQQSI